MKTEYLGLELSWYTEFLGFGYDFKGKDYKVVRFVVYKEPDYRFKAEVHVYTFGYGSNSWKDIDRDQIYLQRIFCYHGLVFQKRADVL